MKAIFICVLGILFTGIFPAAAQELMIGEDHQVANAASLIRVAEQSFVQLHEPRASVLNPSRTTLGISVNPAGYLWEGLSIGIDLHREWFYWTAYIIFTQSRLATLQPDTEYYGFGTSFNYFHHTRLGGFYTGLGVDVIRGRNLGNMSADVGVGLNIGYKFILNSGVFFNLGSLAALSFNMDGSTTFIIRPFLAIGYSFLIDGFSRRWD